MTNNDLLIRLRYALDIKNTDMIEIFELGGIHITKDELRKILTKPTVNEEGEVDLTPTEEFTPCDYRMLDAFLNGFVTFKRGKQEPKQGNANPPIQVSGKQDSANNLFLKKIKVALSLTTDDMIGIFYDAGLNVSKGEIGGILRKADHRNYKECGDNFTRNFLKGLTLKHRS
ncbi:uncharacterized protein YehS (DUF1456 family) [Cytobacillus eiseniae]|uniref:Uncharacterized protein YehS (DUF1456 family) n=1 Tax=Cytobacillus eiseniae TaxID=762947 RepID=A0ABS4RDY6_9BACI|nr:uncharacterized protein YehS (DUF1456 family) [Cytobacillus eiseniae]